MGKIGKRPAASRTGFSQSAPQAMLQAVQPIRLRGQALRRVLQPVCQQVKPLAILLKAMGSLAMQLRMQHQQMVQQTLTRRGSEFGGGGRRRRTLVGCKVGNGEIGFVADTTDDRQGAGADRPGQRFVVEGPQVFETAAATAQDQQITFAMLAGRTDGAGDLCGSPLPLYRRRIKRQVDMRRSPGQRGQHVTQRSRLE